MALPGTNTFAKNVYCFCTGFVPILYRFFPVPSGFFSVFKPYWQHFNSKIGTKNIFENCTDSLIAVAASFTA
jgi:hypothetical protein